MNNNSSNNTETATGSHQSNGGAVKEKYHSKAQTDPHITPEMLKPKYWHLWLASWVLRSVLWLPYPVFMTIGRIMGYISMFIVPRRRRISEQNFRLAYNTSSDTAGQTPVSTHSAIPPGNWKN